MPRTSQILRSTGAVLLLLLVIPCYVLIWIIYGVWKVLADFRCWCSEFYSSVADPDYLPPIGIGGFYARRAYRQEALKAEREYDDDALYSWSVKGARLYDASAMYTLGTYYDSRDMEKNATEWFGLAGSFGHERGKKEFENRCGEELTEEKKRWFRKNFVRHGVLETEPAEE